MPHLSTSDGNYLPFTSLHPKNVSPRRLHQRMSAQQRVALWAAEPDLDDDIHDVDIPLAIPAYPAPDIYDDPNLQLDESALLAVQAQIAQQTALAQIPDVVKRVRPISHHHPPSHLISPIHL